MTDVTQLQFQKALGNHLYPTLRAVGFRGLGNTLRRIAEPVVHVFNVQASSSGGVCYLNLGAHLTFLPSEGGLDVAPNELMEYHCVFRGRFDPPSGPTTGWAYGSSARELDEAISFIVEHWHIYGHGFFDRYSGFPEDFRRLVRTERRNHARDCLTFARIALELDEYPLALEIAQDGLSRCPEGASLLKADLERVVKAIRAREP